MIELNESILDSDVEVIYKGKEYKTGNRYGTLVELWDNHTFFSNVSMNNIEIKNPSIIIESLRKKRNRLTVQVEKINKQIYEFEKL